MPNHSSKDVWEHIEKTNEELGSVKENVATVKNDIKWLKDCVQSLDKKLWFIIIGLIGTIALAILNLVTKI